jgi:DNA repair protein RecN (Recombination protein N)
LGVQLINIHGQHDSAALFDENNHLAYLDAYADNTQLQITYSEKYAVVMQIRAEIRRMSMDESEKLRRMETLRYQIEEIEKAELEAGEDEVLEERKRSILHRR